MRHYLKGFLALSFVFAVSIGSARAETVRVTLDGIYRYVGNDPSPTNHFTLSFLIDRSFTPTCGSPGVTGACMPGQVSSVNYTNGPLDVMLAQSGPPTVLFREAAEGGGFALYQQDLGLNRLGFTIGAAQLFSGTVSAPTLVDGVYSVFGNPHCVAFVCDYKSYAGQSFASGDTWVNPFYDPESLQSYDPLESGTITIAAEGTTSLPEPATAPLLAGGFVALAAVVRRRFA